VMGLNGSDENRDGTSAKSNEA